MRKLAGLCGLLAMLVLPAMAQDQPPGADQNPAPSAPAKPAKVKRTYITPKYELSGGYANRSYYAPTGTLNMSGFYVSLNYNIKRWIGLEGEVVGVGKDQGFSQQQLLPLGNTHIYSFLFGPVIYPLGHRKFAPFGHFMYGGAYYRNEVPLFAGIPSSVLTSTVTSWEVGGGLDLNLWRHWGIRIIEVDYASANFFPNTTNYSNQGSHRFSAGIIYRFGKK
jgi:opacity protein-like surface antigen